MVLDSGLVWRSDFPRPRVSPLVCAGTASPRIYSSPAAVRDAELSVEDLCRKFEALSEKLRREQLARETAERRSTRLLTEVETAEDALKKQSGNFAMELSVNDSSLVVLRASACCAEQRLAAQEWRAQEEHALRTKFEQRCSVLSAELREESASRDDAHARAAVDGHDALQERCEFADIARRLRQVQGDTRVFLEDLRIAQQRAVLVGNELNAFEVSIDAAGRSFQTFAAESSGNTLQLQEKQRQLREHEAHRASTLSTVESIRADNLQRERHLHSVQEESQSRVAQLASLQQSAMSMQLDSQVQGAQLQSEADTLKRVSEDLRLTDMQRIACTTETTAEWQSLGSAVATVENVRANAQKVQVARDALVRHLDELTTEEHRNATVTSDLRRSSRMDDQTLQEVQSELQEALLACSFPDEWEETCSTNSWRHVQLTTSVWIHRTLPSRSIEHMSVQ